MSDQAALQQQFIEGVRKKSVEIVAAALDAGLPINGLWENEAPLHRAVGDSRAHPPIVELLLARGADPNIAEEGRARGRTPLMLDACFHQSKVANLLLAAGADPRLRSDDGMSVLSYGSDPRNEQLHRRALAMGVVPNHRDLWAVAATGNPRMLAPLLAAGLDPNAITAHGSPLHATITYMNMENLLALLRAGADLNLRLPETVEEAQGGGRTPLEHAEALSATLNMKKFIKVLKDAARGVIPPPAGPKVVTPEDLPAVWKALEKALKENREEVKSSLNRGAAEAKVARYEQTLGMTLPPDARASFLKHNGQKDGADGLFPDGFLDLSGEFVLLNLDDSLNEWKSWKKLVDEGEFRGQQSEPPPGVRNDWWNPGWIPLASDGGGNSICVDLAPADGGQLGQVILMDHESGDRPVLAKSWAELLSLLTDQTA
jgi:cell wall assembly regulator SMI1